MEDEKPAAYRGAIYDDIFSTVRSFGRYQRLIWLAMQYLVWPIEAQFLALVLAMGTPRYRCATPNVTCPIQQCCDNCTEYVFEGPMTTTVNEWNLICDRAYLGATTQSCYFAGMLIGSLLTGMMSDAWGRKKCFFICLAIMVLSGLGSAIVDCLSFFAFLRFLVGFGLTGAMLGGYLYCMEFVGPRMRTFSGTIDAVFWASSSFINLMLAYFIRYWRYLLVAYTAPGLLFFLLWRVLPESPRWLVAHGKLDEAQAVVMKYGGKDGKELDAAEVRAVIEDIRRTQLEEEKKAKKYTPLDMLKTRKLRKWTLMLSYQWFACALVNFGVYIFVSQLAGNLFVNYLLMRLFYCVRVVIHYHLYRKIGRRIVHGVAALLSSAMLFIMLAVYTDYPLVTTGLAVISYVISNTWSSVYLITAEIFPTVLRNTGLGTGSGCARVGAVISPYIAMMAQLPGLSLAFPVVIFGVVALLAAVLTYWIPETLYSKMYQTIEEAEAAKDDYRIPCCGKPLRHTEEIEAQEVEAVLMESKPDDDH